MYLADNHVLQVVEKDRKGSVFLDMMLTNRKLNGNSINMGKSNGAMWEFLFLGYTKMNVVKHTS